MALASRTPTPDVARAFLKKLGNFTNTIVRKSAIPTMCPSKQKPVCFMTHCALVRQGVSQEVRQLAWIHPILCCGNAISSAAILLV